MVVPCYHFLENAVYNIRMNKRSCVMSILMLLLLSTQALAGDASTAADTAPTGITTTSPFELPVTGSDSAPYGLAVTIQTGTVAGTAVTRTSQNPEPPEPATAQDPLTGLTPYDTMIAISPTGKTLPQGVGRFNLDELAMQQFNIGLTDRLQLGVNISFILAASIDLKYRFSADNKPWQTALLVGAGTQLIGEDKLVILFSRFAATRFWSNGRLLNITAGLYSGGRPGQPSGSDLFDTGLFTALGSGLPITLGAVLPLTPNWSWINDAGVLINFKIPQKDLIPAGVVTAFRRNWDHYGLQFGWVILLTGQNLSNYFLGVPYIGMNWLF